MNIYNFISQKYTAWKKTDKSEIKFPEVKINMYKEIKKAENNWLCKTSTKDCPCPPGAIKLCIELYPNLKCHKNER